MAVLKIKRIVTLNLKVSEFSVNSVAILKEFL
jgi:hypothetical protein